MRAAGGARRGAEGAVAGRAPDAEGELHRLVSEEEEEEEEEDEEEDSPSLWLLLERRRLSTFPRRRPRSLRGPRLRPAEGLRTRVRSRLRSES